MGIPLLVDEAHGAHFGLHPGLPPSAMQQGADVAVQSTHKTLGALGQASMLHCQGPLVCRQRLAQSLRTLQVLTPNFLHDIRFDEPSVSHYRMCSRPVREPGSGNFLTFSAPTPAS